MVPRAPTLAAAALALAVALVPPASAVEAPVVGATVPSAELGARLQALERDLAEAEDRLEARFGYAGSEVTMREALAKAGFTGRTLAGARGWASRLYTVWGEAKPFFARHREAAAANREVVGAQASCPSSDARWLADREAAVRARVDAMEAAFDELLLYRVERARAMARLQARQAELEQARKTLGQLGGRADPAAVELAEADVAAWAANEEWLADAVQADAAATLLTPLQPVSARARYRVTLRLAGVPEGPADGVAAAAEAAKEALGELGRQEALAGTTIDEASRALAELRRKEDEAVARAAAVDQEIEAAERFGERPEATALRTREQQIVARVEQLRQQIANTPLTTQAGREQAQALAAQVLDLRTELPTLKARLEELSSPASLADWRAERQAARDAAWAEVRDARREQQALVARMADSAGVLQRAQVRAALAEGKAVQAAVADALARAEAGPAVADVAVLANAHTVLEAHRRDPRAFKATLAELTARQDALEATLSVADAVRAVLVREARIAADLRAERRVERPTWLPEATIGASLRAVGSDVVLRGVPASPAREALAGRYVRLGESPLPPERVLERAGRVWAEDVRRGTPEREAPAAADAEGARTERDVLTRAAEAVLAIDEPLPEALEREVKQVERQLDARTRVPVQDRDRRRAEIASGLVALAALPVAEKLSARLAADRVALDQAVKVARARLGDDGGASSVAYGVQEAFLEGSEVEVRLAPREGTAGAAPAVRLGDRDLALQAARGPAGALVYRLGRADGLPATEGAVELHVAAPAAP